ncbi:MAG: WD40 repeat domain-containing protein, partial [Planctomycetia bacterium]
AKDEAARRIGYARRVAQSAEQWLGKTSPKQWPIVAEMRAAPDEADLRGFEWYYLRDQARRHRRLVFQPTKHVHGLGYVDDGRRLACWWKMDDGRAHLGAVDPATGIVAPSPTIAAGRPISEFYSRAGDFATYGIAPPTDPKGPRPALDFLGVLDLRTGGRWEFACPLDAWRDAATTTAGDCLAYCGGERGGADGPTERCELRIRNSTGERRLQSYGSISFSTLRFSQDGRRLAVAYADWPISIGQEAFHVEMWNVDDGRLLWKAALHHHTIFGLQFSPDGSRLATGSIDGKVRLCDAADGRVLHTFDDLGGDAALPAFSPDGRYLAVGTAEVPGHGDLRPNRRLSLWNVESGKPEAPALELTDDVVSIDFSPDGRELAVACGGGTVLGWRPFDAPVAALPGHRPYEAWGAAFPPDGETLATAGDDHEVRLWNIDGAGAEIGRLVGHESLVTAVAFSPAGDRLASCSFDGTVRIWDRKTSVCLAVCRGHDHHVRGVAYSPDGA